MNDLKQLKLDLVWLHISAMKFSAKILKLIQCINEIFVFKLAKNGVLIQVILWVNWGQSEKKKLVLGLTWHQIEPVI